MGNLCSAPTDHVGNPQEGRPKVGMIGYHDNKCLKIIVVGNKGSGKTSLVNAYAYNKYNTDSEPFFNNSHNVKK